MMRTTRREALVTIATGLAAGRAVAQSDYEPATFSREDFDLLGQLVDMILPPSDTPGAREAGVHVMLDEDLATDSQAAGVLRDGMARLRDRGFERIADGERVAALARCSEADGADGEFFATLKELTVDAYYSTEAGLVAELGYRGNTYLAEFPGCTHDHGLEGDD